MKILLRILAVPFVFAIIFIHCNYTAIKRSLLFLRYGGEWIAYDKEKATIGEIYDELKAQRVCNQSETAQISTISPNGVQDKGATNKTA